MPLDDTTYTGGYFMMDEPIVRGHEGNAHTAGDLTNLSNYTVDSLNAVQETPWETNDFVLDTVLALWNEGGKTLNSGGKEVLSSDVPVDPKGGGIQLERGAYWFAKAQGEEALKEFWDNNIFSQFKKKDYLRLSSETKKWMKTRRSILARKYEQGVGKFKAQKRILGLAKQMREYSRYYFPHNLDFRLRMYPIPSDLTPQGADLSQGLLRFHRPTQLGSEGLYWMGFMVASEWGEDKLHPDDRADYANDPEFFAKCEAWVDDPLTNRGWLDADKPFSFLAVAHEFVWAHRSGDPETFFSHLPCNLDGSCNGVQHLSILARDYESAKATNCTADGIRHDFYSSVGDLALEFIQKDVAAGMWEAEAVLDRMATAKQRRAVVKRAAMTKSYGVTDYGINQFMLSDEHVSREEEDFWEVAKYLGGIVAKAIAALMDKGSVLQDYFKECAAITAENGLPLQWETPAGSKVTQAYREIVEKRVRSFSQRFTLYKEVTPDEDGYKDMSSLPMRESKSATSAPPNVIHSFDAAHLQITVCRMHDAGIRDFKMIHDSFGCPMAYAGQMRDILRESIVDMYQGNFLLEWKESVERYSGLTMPEPPELGEFDVNEILDSVFFFS